MNGPHLLQMDFTRSSQIALCEKNECKIHDRRARMICKEMQNTSSVEVDSAGAKTCFGRGGVRSHARRVISSVSGGLLSAVALYGRLVTMTLSMKTESS